MGSFVQKLERHSVLHGCSASIGFYCWLMWLCLCSMWRNGQYWIPLLPWILRSSANTFPFLKNSFPISLAIASFRVDKVQRPVFLLWGRNVLISTSLFKSMTFYMQLKTLNYLTRCRIFQCSFVLQKTKSLKVAFRSTEGFVVSL